MWICPKCESKNENKFCVVCGERKPETASMNTQNQQIQQPSYKEATTPPVPAPVCPTPAPAKKHTALIVTCIILAMLLIAAVVTGVLVIMKLQSENDTPAVVDTSSVVSEQETAEDEPEEEDVEAEEEEVVHDKTNNSMKTDSEGNKYCIYKNTKYDFYCAYPESFEEVTASGVNALKSFESPDGSARMTIRASRDTNGITIEDAMDDFCSAYDGNVSYEANGDTWYAMSIEMDERTIYRKFFIADGNIYCMDFEMDTYDVDFYGVYVEYIEDNFKVNK